MSPSPVRVWLVALALLVCTNGPVFFVGWRILGGSVSWEAPLVRSTFALLAIVGVVWIRLDAPSNGPPRRPSPAVVAVVGFAAVGVASGFWSIAPEITWGRSLIYCGLVGWAWIIADLDFGSLRGAIVAMLVAALGMSALALVLSSTIAVDANGDWRGIYLSRNSLAPLCGIGVIMSLGLVAERRRNIAIGGGALLLASAVMLLGSGSRTAWLALLTSLAASAVVCGGALVRRRFGRPAMVVVGLAVAIGTGVAASVVSALWSEPTFVQRRYIWSFVWRRVQDRPIHGYGWFTAWKVPDFIGDDPLLARGNAHDSLLDVWLGVGLLGLVPFLVIVGLAVAGATRGAWRTPSVASATWLALVTFLVVENVTESFVLGYSYNWVLIMAAALRSGVGWRRSPAGQTPTPIAVASGLPGPVRPARR